MAEARLAEAAATERANVAVQKSEENIVAKTNELRELKGRMDADVNAATKQADKAAAQARAQAEVELQELRRQVETLRLQADVVLPAQAEKTVAEFNARGAAAGIEEEGKAMAEVLQMMTDTWHSAGGDAKDIFLIQQLEQVLQTVVDRVHGLEIDEVTLLDGGDGEALPRHISSYPAMVRQVLDELHASTGVDVTGILAGVASGTKESK
jgi:flotillin